MATHCSGVWTLVCISFLLWKLAFAVSPSPVQCSAAGCIIRNYLGVWPDRKPCKAAAVVYPSTEDELVAAVAYGTKSNSKMKVVSRWSQSIQKLVCPGGATGLVISTKDLNSHVVVDGDNMTVTADAGVLLRDLVDVIAKSGYAFPAATYWDGVSVAGAISTGAHGSSLWGQGTALHDFVVGITLVVPGSEDDGFAKIVHVNESTKELLDAARLSLGVLGAISKVTFKIEPMFKRSVVLEVMPDDDIEDRILEFGANYEFGDVCWHPSLKKAMYKKDVRVPADTAGDGVNRYRGFQPLPSSRIEQGRLAEDRIEALRDVQSLCKLADYILTSRVPGGNGYLNDGVKFTGFPVVGYNNLMQTAGGCQDAAPYAYMTDVASPEAFAGDDEAAEEEGVDSEVCNWDPRVKGSFYHQVAVSVGLDKVKDVILDIKRLRDMKSSSLCGLSIYGGIYLRYLKESSAYLGQKEDAVEFDLTFYRAKDGATPRLNEDVLEEIEQLLLFKYQGKPHWAKNRNMAFDSVGEKVRDLKSFLKVKQELDPAGLFSSEWSDAVLTGEHQDVIVSMHDHCALEGFCVCSEDRHCVSQRGYLCETGKIFEAARVCRYTLQSLISNE